MGCPQDAPANTGIACVGYKRSAYWPPGHSAPGLASFHFLWRWDSTWLSSFLALNHKGKALVEICVLSISICRRSSCSYTGIALPAVFSILRQTWRLIHNLRIRTVIASHHAVIRITYMFGGIYCSLTCRLYKVLFSDFGPSSKIFLSSCLSSVGRYF